VIGRCATVLLAALAALGAPGAVAAASGLHEVRPGESLSTIAAELLGDAALWPALYRANRDQIRDPALVYPGQQLEIPTLTSAEREALLREARALHPQGPTPQ
jgi:nucleoid-associated protein YgaU